MVMTTKTCKRCDKPKHPIDDYYPQTRKGVEYRALVCKECVNKATRKRRAEQTVMKNPCKSLLAQSVANARTKGLEHTITLDDVRALWERQGGKCEVTGLAFDLSRALGSRNAPLRPSLDRRDASKGYTPENIRIVLVAVNTGLSEWGDALFLRIAEAAVAKSWWGSIN